ncbi:hypothetical protein BA195_06725 [Tenacibaculum soleae]|uniref:YopX protein domain-containing protein n=1 Tax=Tenacibaculum soleae TaxID=447689 RepID=A0A1B9Y3G2_9FLAO|nr:YopX family protein [Tenacibaculum soleae]OCK44365.1 hypothetical protein BA195_06725 [Tenacibaculum soleae]
MNKIKAKSLKTGEWVYGYFMYDWDGTEVLKPMLQVLPNRKIIDITSFYRVVIDKDTICQPTGLKDSEGIDIYENDLVIHTIESEHLDESDWDIITDKVILIEGCWCVGAVQYPLFAFKNKVLVE